MRYLILFLLIFLTTSSVYCAERYENIKIKIKSNNLNVFVDGFREIVMAYDLESDFVKDCLISLKTTKKLPTKECSRVADRGKGIENLASIISSASFKNNLLKIASNIDANKSNITKEDLNKLTKNFDQSFANFNKLVKEVNFLLSNL